MSGVKCVCVTDGFCNAESQPILDELHRVVFCCTREQGHFGAHAACWCDSDTGAPDQDIEPGHLMFTWEDL